MDSEKQVWTEEIKSQDSLWSVNLREVWHYRDLLLMLLKRDFITFYKQTILGPIWFFVQPLLALGIYLLVFGKIAKIPTDGVPHLPFFLAGIVVWNYFSDTLTKTSTVFKDNASVFGKVYFPRLIMPLSIVLSGLLKFAIQFSLFLVFFGYYAFVKGAISPNSWILITPLLVLLMSMFALGLGMIFSSMTTKYKDMTFLLTYGIQLFMYATPVVYPSSALPEKYQWILSINPLTGIFECFRHAFLGTGSFDPNDLVYSAGLILALLFAGIIIFNKVEKSFMDTV